MKRTVPITHIIERLQKFPDNAQITLLTKTPVKVVGIVVQKKDGTRMMVDIEVPENKK